MSVNNPNRKIKALAGQAATKHPVTAGTTGDGTPANPQYSVQPKDCTCKRVVLHHNNRDAPPTDEEAVKCPRCGSIIIQIIV